MSISLHTGYPKIVSGSMDSARKITVEYLYILSDPWEMVALVDGYKRKGQGIVFRAHGFYYYGTVESVSFARSGNTSNGVFHVTATVTIALGHTSQTNTDPCAPPMKPYNFKISGASIDETSEVFYPCEGDLLFASGSNDPQPFTNTAGVHLEATRSRGMVQISFSYNLATTYFNVGLVWQWLGKTNIATTTICGIVFGPRTVKIENLSYDYTEDTVTNPDESTTTWQYYRGDVSLSCDPQTWNKKYLNVGTSIVSGGKLQQLYTWYNKTSSVNAYGTYHGYPGGVTAESLDAVTDPMFLNASGTDISGFDSDGRQNQTYRYGSLLIPADFTGLYLPTLPPNNWNI